MAVSDYPTIDVKGRTMTLEVKGDVVNTGDYTNAIHSHVEEMVNTFCRASTIYELKIHSLGKKNCECENCQCNGTVICIYAIIKVEKLSPGDISRLRDIGWFIWSVDFPEKTDDQYRYIGLEKHLN